MPTTSYKKDVTTLRERLKALVEKDWTGKIDTLSLQTNKLIVDASTALRTTFDNVLKETSKVGGKLFDTSLARGVTQSKDIAEIYKEYTEQIQKIQNQEYKELTEKIEEPTEPQKENIMLQETSSNEVRNALGQDIMKKIPEIFLSPLNVAANIVSAILRCLIAIVETAVLGILTLNAQILPEELKQTELKQIDDYKSFVQESVINAKSYSHAILAYATKIKENASTYLETHDNPSYSRDNKEEAKELLHKNPPDEFEFFDSEIYDKAANQKDIQDQNPISEEDKKYIQTLSPKKF